MYHTLSIGLRDLEFDHVFMWGRKRPEDPARYWWIPIGMPRIGKKFAQSVFFLFAHKDNTHVSRDRPLGTGFFVAKHSDSLPFTWHIYAVSNWHVARDAPFVRVNTWQSSRILEVEHEDWINLLREDLAAADVTDHLGLDYDTLSWSDEFSWVDESSFVQPPEKGMWRAEIGDDTFMIGLFEDHRRGERNSPVGRFGIIAAIPNDSVPVKLSENDEFPAPGYLNDMRSRTGFSGSRVWQGAIDLGGDNPWDDPKNEGVIFVKPFVKLLGVHRGQIWERTEVKECQADSRLVGAELSVASSMTAVVPSWKISALLENSALKEQRDQRDRREDRIALHAKIRGMIRSGEMLPKAYQAPAREPR